jgi:hypothetical protein
MDLVTIARENATLREEFLRRGLVPEDELDQIGWVSHSDLDLWQEAGVLELGVTGLQETWGHSVPGGIRVGSGHHGAWGLGALSGDIFNRRILRGRGGRFAGSLGGKSEVPGKSHNRRIKNILHPPRVSRVEHPGAKKDEPIATVKTARGIGLPSKKLNVYATPPAARAGEPRATPGLPERMSAAQAQAEFVSQAEPAAGHPDELHALGRERLRRMADAEHKAGVSAWKAGDTEAANKHHRKAGEHMAAIQNPDETLKAGTAEIYERRTKRLEKRISRTVKKAGKQKRTPAARQPRGPNDLSAAEAQFNDAGRVSQKTLLAYVEQAASQPSTASMYRDANGNYHPSRAALHADIIDKLMRQHGTTTVMKDGVPVEEDAGLSGTTPALKPPADGKPTVIFTGGGYAAGKGGVVKQLKRQGQWPDDALLLDPDLIKAELPEFQNAAMDDPEANLRVYAEAWDIAQQAMKMAQERGLNVVVDGITDTSPDEVAQRVKTFTDKGYVNPRIIYVSVPTDEAIKRAKGRAAKAETPADRRMIPEVIMRAVHRDVSATLPGVMSRAKDMGASVQVFDTDQGKDETTGKFNPPKLVAEATPEGNTHYPDSEGYQAILNKAQETIPNVPEVEAPQRGAWQTGGQITSIDKAAEKAVGRDLAAATPHAPEAHRGQPTSDVGELSRIAKQQGHPAYQALMSGVADALGATVHDTSAGKSFGDTGKDIAANMGQTHVIIAPPKDEKRALAKVAGLGQANNVTDLHDMVRGTVTVPTARDLPTAMAKIRREMEQQGWAVENVNPRLADENGSKRSEANGYGDTQLILRGPKSAGGMLAELQLTTNPMWWAKEVGPGHDLYKLERQVTTRASAEKRKPTNEESKLAGEIQKAAKPMYDRAWGASLSGGIHGHPDVVLGNKKERSASVAKIKELGRKTAGLVSGTPAAARAAA